MIGTNKTLESGALLRLYKAPIRTVLPAWCAFCEEIRKKTNIKIDKDTLLKIVKTFNEVSTGKKENNTTIRLRDIDFSAEDILSSDFVELIKDLLLSVIGSELIMSHIIGMGEHSRYNDKAIEWSLFDTDEDACRDMIRILYSIVEYNISFFLPKGLNLAFSTKDIPSINTPKQ